jgi:hypothetical protein
MVAPSIEGYDVFTPYTSDGKLLFNKTANSFCGASTDPTKGHAPEIWRYVASDGYLWSLWTHGYTHLLYIPSSSDSQDLAGCMAQCAANAQCTCLDFINATVPANCDFSISLNGIECLDLAPTYDPMATPEACEMACCAAGYRQCEAWQYTTDPVYKSNCFLGKIGPSSCTPSKNWRGGSMAAPNQMFRIVNNKFNGAALQSIAVDSNAHKFCVHAKPNSPIPIVIPDKTPVQLQPCDGLTNQQFVLDANHTIRLQGDPTACLDGAASSPSMRTCFTDLASGDNVLTTLLRQSWYFNTTSDDEDKLFLPGALAQACTTELNVIYEGGVVTEDECVATTEECCTFCEINLDCTYFTYHTIRQVHSFNAKAMFNTAVPHPPLEQECKVRNEVKGSKSTQVRPPDRPQGFRPKAIRQLRTDWYTAAAHWQHPAVPCSRGKVAW